jgi:TetR/AcrR family transcriptional repressor of mexCD-oprJ operon
VSHNTTTLSLRETVLYHGRMASARPLHHDRTASAILDAAAHVLAERTDASMSDVAAAAGVGRATLYRYYPSREALLDALAGEALLEAGARLADAGLDRVPVPEAIERIVRALVAVGDRYFVLARERIRPDAGDSDRLLAAPLRSVFERGIAEGILRGDVPVDVLYDLFGGLLGAAVRLVGERRIGLEEIAATTTALFLDGARAR